MDVKTLKIISIPIILVVNFVIGIFPYCMITRKIKHIHRQAASNSSEVSDTFVVSPKMKRFLTLANFFCGGVFFGTSLIGLYPTVHSKFQDIHKRNNIKEYPYAGLSLAAGFFLVWILEILVHACIHSKGHSHTHSSRNSVENNDIHKNSKSFKVSFSTASPTSPLYPEDPMNQPQPSDRLLGIEDHTEDGKVQLPETGHISAEKGTHEPHSHVPMKGNLLGSIMLTFALGSHSIIEGLGYAMIDNFKMTMNMLITVLIHESVCAISLGVSLATKRTPVAASLSLLATFASLIPVGIGIGLAAQMGLEKNLLGDVVTAVLQGVAAGTFIYVVFMEILPAEILESNDAALKAVMMVTGFAVIAIMKIYHPHSHKSPTNYTVNPFNFSTKSPPYTI